MATALPSKPFEFLLVDDSGFGITLNTDVNPYAPFVDIDTVSGLDSPDFRETFRDHEGADGGFLDAEFEKGREINLSGTVYGPADMIEGYLDQLKQSFAPRRTPTKFYYYVPTVGLRFMYVKTRGIRYDWSQARRIGTTPIQFKLYAEDPRQYTVPINDYFRQVSLYAATGFGFNLGFSFGFGSTSAADTFTINNLGNRPSPLTVKVIGPAVDWRLISDTVNGNVSISTSLTADDYEVVDMLNHTVKLNGLANRRADVYVDDWFLVQPGSNTLRYQINTPGGYVYNPILNGNPYFDSGTSLWGVSAGEGSIVASTDYAFMGTGSAKVTYAGVAQNNGPISEFIAATAGTVYTCSGWIYVTSPQSFNAAINWYDAGQASLSSSFGTVKDVVPNTWTRISLTATAPASTAFAKARPNRSTNTPPAGYVAYTDVATFSVGGNPPSLAQFEWASAWR